MDHYRQALKSDPNFTNAHINLGVALAESGRHGEAIASFRAALELRAGDGEILYRLARA